MNSPSTASLKEKVTDLLALQFKTFFTVSFSLYLTSGTAMAILRSLPLLHLFSLMISLKDLPSLCFWVINPISNPYLSSFCLNTHFCLSLVLLLLKSNKALQHALEGLSTASLKSVSTLSCLSKSKANFIIFSLIPSFPSSASHSLKLLYIPSLQLFRQIQKAGHCCVLSVLS